MMMGLGASPVLANVCGYLVGLVLGFMVSKKLVFRSQGHFTSEGLRYLAAFLVCFLINLIVLKLCLDSFHWHPVLAQCVAAVTYTAIMYLLSRFLVFKAGMNKAPADEQE
jgi:putative flippase GtrA